MEAILAASHAYLPVLPGAAPEIPDYPQFEQVPVPAGSGATCAWEGTIQPFVDDAAGSRFLRCVEAGLPFDVVEGTIIALHGGQARVYWSQHFCQLIDLGKLTLAERIHELQTEERMTQND